MSLLIPGTRTTGNRAGNFLIVGPAFAGASCGDPSDPKGPDFMGTSTMPILQSPTNIIWIIGRTYWDGTAQDLEVVHAIQDGYTLTPVNSLPVKEAPELLAPHAHTINVRDRVNSLSASQYFRLLAQLLVGTPPAPEDAPIINQMKRIGLYPTYNPSIDIKQVPVVALERIRSYRDPNALVKNNWTINLDYGDYGTNYLFRATTAYISLGANLAVDAVYPHGYQDSQGDPLEGKYRYRIHFTESPPVNAFWSITLYNDQYFLSANPLNRYNLSPRNNLIYNTGREGNVRRGAERFSTNLPDGSLDIYLSNAPFPANDPRQWNWLPAPLGKFVLTFRLYWPQQVVLDGIWSPPPIEKI